MCGYERRLRGTAKLNTCAPVEWSEEPRGLHSVSTAQLSSSPALWLQLADRRGLQLLKSDNSQQVSNWTTICASCSLLGRACSGRVAPLFSASCFNPARCFLYLRFVPLLSLSLSRSEADSSLLARPRQRTAARATRSRIRVARARAWESTLILSLLARVTDGERASCQWVEMPPRAGPRGLFLTSRRAAASLSRRDFHSAVNSLCLRVLFLASSLLSRACTLPPGSELEFPCDKLLVNCRAMENCASFEFQIRRGKMEF